MKSLVRLLILLWCGVLLCPPLSASPRADSVRREYKVILDENQDKEAEERTRQLYDSLKVKSRSKTVTRLLFDLLVKSPSHEYTSTGRAVNERNRYWRFNGRRIASIEVVRAGVFDRDGNWLERAGNTLHIETRERVIRRDLMVEVGDTVDADELVRNMQLLRSRRYISDAEIVLEPDSVNPMLVHLKVKTRDSWTITFDGHLGGSGETMVAISDDNIFGWGNRLEVQTNFNRRTFGYGGTIVEYRMPNMWGTFIEGRISAGREFDESEFIAEVTKSFIRPTDMMFGITYKRERTEFEDANYPDLTTTLNRQFNLWAGYSYELKGLEMSLFAALRYCHSNYRDRPAVTPDLNPYYHRREELLGSMGIYRERFYTANMIYGYGTREYIPTGFRAELVSGYNWGEFREGLYLGGRLRGGRFTSAGFFSTGVEVGSYLSLVDGSRYRTVGDFDLNWFSNLLPVRKCHLRQFVTLNYTHGWNRLSGYNETVDFTSDNGLRILDEDFDGIQRLSINTETVVFTPFQPWGFRFTCYGFADMGVIGHSDNIFRNSLYGSVGIGVRIRNERLIFGAIQFQLGIAFGKGGWADSEWIELTSQEALEQRRFRPSRPQTIPFE